MALNANSEFDPRFYTEYRYEGAPETEIADFCDATRELLERFVSDLRSTELGPFGLESNDECEQIAIGVERTIGHVDRFRSLASGDGVPADAAPIVTNLVANVLADANAAEVARARARAPKARQAKFDQGKTGSAVDGMAEYADKIKDIGEGIAKIFDLKIMEGLVDVLSGILKDIAMNGAKAAENTGGNEATRQIEEKLDYVMPIVDGLATGQSDAADVLRRIREISLRVQAEVDNIEYKAERLGDLLGKTLVGSSWDVRREWDLHPHTTGRVTPPLSIKEEMHGIEDSLTEILLKLNRGLGNLNIVVNFLTVIVQFIINVFPAKFFSFFDEELAETTFVQPTEPPLFDERLKKIYVYAEDTFAPQSSTSRRTIDVRTAAFDLSGWIDLTELRPGDIVEVSTFVTVSGRRRRFDRRRFDQAGLLPFADFARGVNTIVGSDVRIQIRQAASADGFQTPIDVGYQFVVESQ